MKRLLITFIGALTLAATLPVLAGPDLQAIEQARKAKQVAQADLRATRPVSGARSPRCPPKPLVLPLDHGPRADHACREPAAQEPL